MDDKTTHHHWCEIRGHWFPCDKPHGLEGTKESGGSVELRGDCPECAGFHWFKIPRWLGYFWRHYVCDLPTRPYWRWRASLLRCEVCGASIKEREGDPSEPARLRSVLFVYGALFHQTDGWVCEPCRHFPKPDCGPDCPACEYVDGE